MRMYHSILNNTFYAKLNNKYYLRKRVLFDCADTR